MLPLGDCASGKAGGGLDQSGILRQPAIGLDEVPVGSQPLIGLNHCSSSLTQQRRTVRTTRLGDRIELGDKIVIQLYENFAAWHDRMVIHMHRL